MKNILKASKCQQGSEEFKSQSPEEEENSWNRTDIQIFDFAFWAFANPKELAVKLNCTSDKFLVWGIIGKTCNPPEVGILVNHLLFKLRSRRVAASSTVNHE